MNPKIENPKLKIGFTLVELLVVITIIVVLLALLAPAMDQAIYQAELAVCAARLRGIGASVSLYAGDYQRAYPHREATNPDHSSPRQRWGWANAIVDEWTTANTNAVGDGSFIDDRPPLYAYLGGDLKALHDPLTGGTLNYSADKLTIFVDYNLWFGVRYRTSLGGGRGMHRMGDRLEWSQSAAGPRETYSVLAGDNDTHLPQGGQTIFSSHPDRDAGLYFTQYDGRAAQSPWMRARWERTVDEKHGLLDLNYAYADGSARQLRDVRWDDTRVSHLPMNVFGNSVAVWTNVPDE